MAYLVNYVSTETANTDGVTNIAPIFVNNDPAFVAKNLLTTIYSFADVWGAAQLQIYITPWLPRDTQHPIVWFPLGDPITANGFFSFQHRWGQIKAEVVNAGDATAGLSCILALEHGRPTNVPC